MNSETIRLQEAAQKKNHWRKWGPYLSEREWGTVREDYSTDGNAWEHFPFEQARSRAYRWGEDGIGGISDNHQKICLAFAFWNEKDEILKERLFGLSGPRGNHGEDVKEVYYYLDNLPTHAYMKYLYKYPLSSFPYRDLTETNRNLTSFDLEYELVDTGIFDANNYCDIFIEYAKADAESFHIKVTIINRSKNNATVYAIPTLWFRNTWEFSKSNYRPVLEGGTNMIKVHHRDFGERFLYCDSNYPHELLFTENTSNLERLYGTPNATPYVKDAFHDFIIHNKKNSVNPALKGTKAAASYKIHIAPQSEIVLHFLFTDKKTERPFENAENIVKLRKQEADEFYSDICCPKLKQQELDIQRQAFAGLLWNKQFYNYVVEDWLNENPLRNRPLNRDWVHLYNDDILLVPDKWEYPCFFSWDTAFHAVAIAMVDPELAKRQLTLLTREWYMHPNGQLPASEWNFNDVNPPVHAWAIWRVYKIEQKIWGHSDLLFLERAYQKLLLNFTWWVNRKDAHGKNIFQGGFLGLDNISVFNRSEEMPPGWTLYQSDATSWMGMYCLNMLAISFELAQHNKAYEDMASKFFEHFLYISNAINHPIEGINLWDDHDGFYYDFLYSNQGEYHPLKVRSLVGLIPLFAVTPGEPKFLEKFPEFRTRMLWFLNNKIDLCSKVASTLIHQGMEGRRLLAIVNKNRLQRILEKMLDEKEFLSPYGIRSLSKYHQDQPFSIQLNQRREMIDYEPAESTSRMFGGNSNWRGPIWLPLNMLIIESLQKFHYYYGNDLRVECPTGSGKWMNLNEVALEISRRLLKIFQVNPKGERPLYGGQNIYQNDPHWNKYILFYEYFHGDNGAGIGASHQTGWTALIAKLIQQLGENSYL